jgi:hypothetical protein
VIRTKTGKLQPVCEFCGKVGRPATPFDGGDRLSIVDVAQGWGEVPYPDDFTHPDGSTGSLWRCPACEARMDRGETMYGRMHIHDWVLDRSDYEPCVCGAVMPEPPF